MRLVHFGNGEPIVQFAKQNLTNQTGLILMLARKHVPRFRQLKNLTSSKWIHMPKNARYHCNKVFGYNGSGRSCTSGVVVIWWNAVTRFCDELVVFGANQDKCYPYHYYEDPVPSCQWEYPCCGHNYTLEHAELLKMHRAGKIRLARIEEEIGFEQQSAASY